MVTIPTLQLSSEEVRAFSQEERGLACRYYRTYMSSCIFPLADNWQPMMYLWYGCSGALTLDLMHFTAGELRVMFPN